MSYYRIQNYDPQELLVGEQTSISYNDDTERAGKSVCTSLESLAAYLVQVGIPFDTDYLVVELDGYSSDDVDEDAALGARLVHPTEILSVTPITDQLLEMIDAAYEN